MIILVVVMFLFSAKNGRTKVVDGFTNLSGLDLGDLSDPDEYWE